MSSFVIKLIAIIAMLIDHSSDALIGKFSVLNIVGRLAFPLFCFQLVVGYYNTSNIKKYMLRLLCFALVSQIPFSIFMNNFLGSPFYLNVFFTLLFGLICLYVYDTDKLNKSNSKILTLFIRLVIISAIMLIAHFFKTDYQAFGIFMILCIRVFYPYKSKLCTNMSSSKLQKNISNNYFVNIFTFVIVMLLLCIFKYISYFTAVPLSMTLSLILFTFMPALLMLLYNGKKGPSGKYLFYAFYPVHIAILDLIVSFMH